MNVSVLGAGLSTTFVFAEKTSAMVSMRDANYFNSWMDLDMSRSHPHLKVRRHYSSRSRFNGIFGYGWCTDLEAKVRKVADGRVAYFECGSGAEVTYSPAPGRSGVFTSNTRPGDEIYEGIGFFTRLSKEGSVQKFNSEGQLLAIADRSGSLLSILRDRRGRIAEAKKEKAWIRFTYDPKTQKLSSVSSSSGRKIDYSHEGDDLVSVKEKGRVIHDYKYDELHNLTRIDHLGKPKEWVTYDPELDRVASLRASDGCSETYAFKTAGENPGRFASEAVKTCKGREVARVRFDFWYDRDPRDGSHHLARMRIDQGTEFTEIAFHPVFGRPLLVNRNGATTRFSYDNRGEVLSANERAPTAAEKAGASL